MDLLNVELRLKPEQSKTNVNIPFEVEQELSECCITYSYWPKKIEDREKALLLIEEGMKVYATADFRDQYPPSEAYLPVVNLVTLSLDGPDGYRGCAHRHAPEQVHHLTAEEASPGFLTGRLMAGNWAAVLNIHAVVTEECIVKLHITGKAKNALQILI